MGPNSLVPITCRVISATLSSFSNANPVVVQGGLQVLATALTRFPLAIIQVTSTTSLLPNSCSQRSISAIQKLIQLFECLMEMETTKPNAILPSTSTITTSIAGGNGLTMIESSNEDSSRATKRTRVEESLSSSSQQSFLPWIVNSVGQETVLRTMSALIVTASVFLPIDLRTQIERIICSGLMVLQQGILHLNYSNDQKLLSHYHTLLSLDGSSSHPSASSSNSGSSSIATSAAIRSTNKLRIRRNFNCEPIRYNSSLQNQLLSLALYELTTLYPNGNRSANLSLLKDVCQLCCEYPETQKISFEVLLTLENLSFPSGGGCGGSNLIPILGGTAASVTENQGVNEISPKIFQEMSSPQEEVYLVNRMIPVIQREKQRVEDFISHFGKGPLTLPIVTPSFAHDDQGENGQGSDGESKEKRIPTPYPVGGQLMMKSIPPLTHGRPQGKGPQEQIKDDESDEDVLLPEINLADPDLN